MYGLIEHTIKQLVAKKINSCAEPDWYSSYDEDELNVENAGKGFFNVFAVQAWHSSNCEDHVDGCGGEPVATVKVDYDRDTKKATFTLYKLEEYRGGRWIHGERMDIEPVTADIAAYIQGQKEDLQRELEETTKLLQERLDDLEEDTIEALVWASGGEPLSAEMIAAVEADTSLPVPSQFETREDWIAWVRKTNTEAQA